MMNIPLRNIPLLDAEGVRVAIGNRVEQAAVDEPGGALPCRLHRQGEVIGRGRERLFVCFAGERGSVGLLPDLVRVLSAPGLDPARRAREGEVR